MHDNEAHSNCIHYSKVVVTSDKFTDSFIAANDVDGSFPLLDVKEFRRFAAMHDGFSGKHQSASVEVEIYRIGAGSRIKADELSLDAIKKCPEFVLRRRAQLVKTLSFRVTFDPKRFRKEKDDDDLFCIHHSNDRKGNCRKTRKQAPCF